MNRVSHVNLTHVQFFNLKVSRRTYCSLLAFHPDTVKQPETTGIKKVPEKRMSYQSNPSKMELDFKIKKTESQDLLSCGDGIGLHDKLLLKSSKVGTTLQTERIPRSSVLDRLQSFLPQMAKANETLKRAMEQYPPGHFDIESVKMNEKIIEMDVEVVELSDSDNDSEDSSQTGKSDSDEECELTEESLKLPGNSQRYRKVNIQVLENEEV